MPHPHSLRVASRALLVVLLAALLLPAAPAHAQVPVARPHPDGLHLAHPDGRLLFVLGYNYEGPFDRAWQMWARFDAGLIADDLARARAGGANTVRVFVQEPLPAAILAGDFGMLDTLVELAARNGLYLLLTLHDYGERDLARVAEVDRRIAERYRDNPTILAYDLRNEPQFITLATATYPGGPPPLQRADLVPVYGERIGMAAIAGYRASGDGRPLPPEWSDAQVYAYANNLAYFRELIAAGERWVVAAPGRTIADYLYAPEAQGWAPLVGALNDTLAAWIAARAGPLRQADPARMLTIGWSNSVLAALPANGALDFMSLHRYPRPSAAAVGQILDLGAALRRAFPGRPVLFEEIGFATSEADEQTTASLEMAVALRAYAEGYAGMLKWMLTDLPPVGNPREDSFGALRIDATPKPIFHVLGAFGTYLGATSAAPGGQAVVLRPEEGRGHWFVHRDAVYVAGQEGSYGNLTFRLDGPGQVVLRADGALYLLATQPGRVALNLRALLPPWNGGDPLVERKAGAEWRALPHDRSADLVSFAVEPATPYRVRVPGALDAASARPGCRYFPETRHNLCGAFRAYWERSGGLAIFGYPLSEEHAMLSADGQVRTVQYFERNRFEYHAEHAGTPYEVLLGLLGSDQAAARRGEAPFLPVGGPPPGADFFPETGHSLGGAFRAYWQRNGGLAVFGYPISEEFQERNPADGSVYTVQYFERNRFEYHPELAGTPHEVLLGLLGSQLVDGNGWR